jgi:Zinc dependent phospholipase C
MLTGSAHAYSVLTHEAIIDSAWDTSLKPLLLRRFPGASAEALIEAHAHAYAGAIIQDMGYYPFGSKLFSDLVHYVRSGEFIVNLIRQSRDLDEYAFALGSLAHYAADTAGHAVAVNRAVPIEYPELRAKFGEIVTYDEDATSHMRVEFSFDVLQVARGNYAPQAYHDFIGFKVSKEVLERAFVETYDMELKDIFKSLDLAIGTYRRSVSTILPQMTKVAWNLRKDDLTKARPGLTRREFTYNLSRASYHKEWGKVYEKPGVVARVIGFFVRIVPKIGPLKALKFKPPTPEVDQLFQDSFNWTLENYRALLATPDLRRLDLANRNFDTGALTRPGEYRRADEAYATLATKLAQKDTVDPRVRDSVLAFFRDLNEPYAMRDEPEEWRETVAAVEKLRAQRTARR